MVVCTRDRTDQLRGCLGALRVQKGIDFETLVVDNAPADSATRELIFERYWKCRYVVEPAPGVAFARNRGIALARGEIIAFLDDDCRPGAGWLRAIAKSFTEHPHLGCCTGPVLPLELKTPAQALLEARGGFNKGFHRRLFGRESGAVYGKSYPLQTWRCGTGGNMAFRRCVLDRIGLFDEHLQSAEDLESSSVCCAMVLNSSMSRTRWCIISMWTATERFAADFTGGGWAM